MMRASQSRKAGPTGRHKGERGISMLMVMTVMATLLLATSLGVGMRMSSLTSSGRSKASKRAYFCADAGLNAGVKYYRQNAARWNEFLQTGYILTVQVDSTDPALVATVGISNDVDHVPADPTFDHNQRVLVRSACTDADSLQFARAQQYLTMRQLTTQGGNVPVRKGQVTYSTTTDFTNDGAIANCNGCGLIKAGSVTDQESVTGVGTGHSVLGNNGISAMGVDLRNDQIILAAKTAYPFIWVPNSLEGTVSKINTADGTEMARYVTGPNWGNPSRTTVDLNGDLYVTNRCTGAPPGTCMPTITKIGLFENGACVDRNNDGLINTSTGGNDVKGWTSTWGDVSGAVDECILWQTILTYPNTPDPTDARMVVVDADNNIYAGGLTANSVYYVRGTDGTIMDGWPSQQGHYGGVMDRDGFIWSMHVGSGYVEKIDPTQKTSVRYPMGHPGYGVAIDIYGHIWNSSWTPNFSRMDPDGTNLQVFTQHKENSPSDSTIVGQTGCCAQGITTNGDGDVFLAGSLSSAHVGHYHNDGSFVRNYQVGAGPTGVAIDASGNVWALSYYAQQASRIDPQTTEKSVFALAGHSYTYSDSTGYVVRTITAPTGEWTVTQNCGDSCTSWNNVSWNANVPSGAAVKVHARAAANLTALKTATWVTLKNGVAAPTGSLQGSLIQVEVRLSADRASGNSPTVYDLTITPN